MPRPIHIACDGEIRDLAALSARIGRDPLLAQASSGNTSIKIGDFLWIKASGKWLASALNDEDAFVPVPLADLRGDCFSGTCRASIETASHAVLPQKVVIHVHSVNTIAWAVRSDGPERLAQRLNGIAWHWIPYVPSGLPLARMIGEAVAASPELRVFVLANHGLIVCGDDCEGTEKLLAEVDRRLAVSPRSSECCDDPVSRRILTGGILYPCQAMFLGTDMAQLSNQGLTTAQRAVLDGLMQVVRRIDEAAPIRYLSRDEVSELLTEDLHRYLERAENNASKAAVPSAAPGVVPAGS